MNTEHETLLTQHGIRPTANRISILRMLSKASRPISLMELEAQADSLDKSTIFRTLSLFSEQHLVHRIEDEAGIIRYELCTSHHNGIDNDMHVHFSCTRCHRLTCLTDVAIPSIALPDGYTATAATFMIKGLCPDCRKKDE